MKTGILRGAHDFAFNKKIQGCHFSLCFFSPPHDHVPFSPLVLSDKPCGGRVVPSQGGMGVRVTSQVHVNQRSARQKQGEDKLMCEPGSWSLPPTAAGKGSRGFWGRPGGRAGLPARNGHGKPFSHFPKRVLGPKCTGHKAAFPAENVTLIFFLTAALSLSSHHPAAV